MDLNSYFWIMQNGKASTLCSNAHTSGLQINFTEFNKTADQKVLHMCADNMLSY